MILYRIDNNNVFTGESKEVSLKDPIPRCWVHIAPPEGEGYKFWDGSRWIILQEYRTLPQPSIPRTITVFEFRRRFTLEEKIALELAKESDVILKIFIDDLMSAQEVDLNDPEMKAGMDYIVSKGLLSPERENEITS